MFFLEGYASLLHLNVWERILLSLSCGCFRGVFLDPDPLALSSSLITADILLAIGLDLGFEWDLTLCWERIIGPLFPCSRFSRTLTSVTWRRDFDLVFWGAALSW